MPIFKQDGQIVYQRKTDRWSSGRTGVFADTDFAIAADYEPLKQIKFNCSLLTGDFVVTLQANASTASDITITLPPTSGTLGYGGSGGGVQSVTGLNTNNTDPTNPIVQISVDGTTITGAGTPGSPLVASGGGSLPSGSAFEILQLNGTPSPVFSGVLRDASGNESITPTNRTSIGSDSSVRIDWENGFLKTPSNNSADWLNRELFNDASVVNFEWDGSFTGGYPVAPIGLIVGVDTLGPEVLKVASSTGQILADFCQAQDDTTAMVAYSTFSGGTKNAVLEQNFFGPGNSGGRGVFNSLPGEEYDWAFSWDSSDYGTRFRKHRLGFFAGQSYVAPFSLDGTIQQAVDGSSGLNNYARTQILDSSVSTGQYYDRITDEFGNEFQNIHYLKGTGNTVAGSYTVPFQGWLNQQTKLTDDTDTGWALQFRDEDFARVQFYGDSTYQMQIRDASRALIGGFRGLRPVINSANVTPQTLTPTGNYIEYVDETGGSHWIPTYA